MTVETQIDEKVTDSVKQPSMWKVVIMNDDVSTMELVVHLLVSIFGHNASDANKVMLQIHQEGAGIAGVYSFEIAEQKGIEATNIARANGAPLKIQIEEE